MFRKFWCVSFLIFLLASPFIAWAEPPKEGTYVSSGGYDTLIIDGERFSMESQGANGHTCTLEGKLATEGGQAVLNLEKGILDPACKISFQAMPDHAGYRLIFTDPSKGSGRPCGGYCGARAYFADQYLAVTKNCEPKEIADAVSMLRSSETEKEIQVINSVLLPILKDCKATISERQRADLLLTIALGYYHAQNSAACRQILADEILSGADRTDPQILNDYSYAPADAFDYMMRAKRTRDIRDLCKK